MSEMSKERKEELKRYNELQTDWYAYCPKCRQTRYGTIEELKRGCPCGSKDRQ